uniref:Uncharacterized protein n=1 Tax=Octopus bimaculoides TaxID=37653 RepID=A0A0L8IHS9_OCTBM
MFGTFIYIQIFSKTKCRRIFFPNNEYSLTCFIHLSSMSNTLLFISPHLRKISRKKKKKI